MVRLGRDEETPPRVVYLFSSGSRRLYLEDVFNALAYPPGFVIQFRYREPWVDDRIQNVDALEGSEAIVVSCPRVFQPGFRYMGGLEKEHCGYNYYPLRRGTIIRARERGGAIHVYCKLGPDIVEYPEENTWGAKKPLSHPSNLSKINYRSFCSHPGSYILRLDYRPRMGEEKDANDVFISLGPDLGIPFYDSEKSPEQAWIDQEDEWIRLVEFLAEDSFFKENLFYRLTEIRPISNTYGYRFRHPIRSLFWSRTSVENVFTDTTAGYKIDSGGQYRLSISLAFAGPPPDQARKDRLILDSSDLIDTFPADFNLGFRTDERSIIVDPTSVGRHNYSAIDVKVDNREDSYTAPRLGIKFDLYPTLTRRIGVPLLLIFGVVVVIASGSVADPISDFVTQQVPEMSPDEGSINLLLTLVGLTITTIGFQLRN